MFPPPHPLVREPCVFFNQHMYLVSMFSACCTITFACRKNCGRGPRMRWNLGLSERTRTEVQTWQICVHVCAVDARETLRQSHHPMLCSEKLEFAAFRFRPYFRHALMVQISTRPPCQDGKAQHGSMHCTLSDSLCVFTWCTDIQGPLQNYGIVCVTF